MIEAPSLLQSTLSIPPDHFAACHAQNLPTVGNAAGNDVDFLDLTGAPEPPGRLPAGFTARGVVALVFSCLSALLGIAVISWYVLVQSGFLRVVSVVVIVIVIATLALTLTLTATMIVCVKWNHANLCTVQVRRWRNRQAGA